MVGRLTLALSPLHTKPALFDHQLATTLEDIIPLPRLESIGKGFPKAAQCTRVIRELERRCDVLVVQLPFEAPISLWRARRPRVYHICADILAFAKCSSRFARWKRAPALAVGTLIDRMQAGLFRRQDVRVLTNGQTLREHYGSPPGRAVVSSTLRSEEVLSVKRQRPANAPFRLLYVGYIRHEKGTDLLIDAFDRVLETIPQAELEIVGATDGGSKAMGDAFQAQLARVARKGVVRFLGHRSFGPELFECYANADALIVPSRTEGTPRVVVEARAFGCPVIATAVGGIPTALTHGVDGLLVPPENSAALADAVLRIAQDRQLQSHLVAEGIKTARRSTVEAFTEALAAELVELMSPRGFARSA
jgi:glycosyltransferase involved in cell wall biosynthesis